MGVVMATSALSAPAAMPGARVRQVSGTVVAQASALVAYGAWVVFVALHHEAWFDEMQAWLLARDNTLGALFGHYVRYEGTPGLWHLVLWCAAHGGLPFTCLWMISATCAMGGAAVIVFRAPFPLPLRLGLLATYFYGYQFSVIARGYCLDLLLVPLVAHLFATRCERPLRYALAVGLLANVNAFSFLAGGLLGLDLLVRLVIARRWFDARAIGALLLVGALGLVALATAWQPADNGFLAQTSRLNPLAGGFIYLANALFDRITPWSTLHQHGADVVAGIVLSLGLLGLIVRLVLAGRDRALVLVMLGTLIGFASVIYAGSWHAGVLFTFVLFVLWTQWHNPVDARMRIILVAALAVLELAQGVQTLRSGMQDLAGDYSAGRPAAAAVTAWRAAHPGKTIAAFGGQSFEVQPWLPENVFVNYHGAAPHPQFVVWTTRETWHALPRPAEWGALLATHPDAILASRIWLPKAAQRDPAGQACRAGYAVLRLFPAAMPWRGIPQDNTLILFERASSGPCSGATS
jgi:hypothetical protein